MRALGARELLTGIGLLTGRRSARWTGARVLGDASDLALLGLAIQRAELREAIRACRNGGIVSVIGVYGGFIDTFPMGSVVNRGLTIRAGQCHVQRYMKPLLERIQRGEIDPSFVITHRLPLDHAPQGFSTFLEKEDSCMKVVLRT